MQKLPCIMLVDDDATTNFLNEELLTSLGVTDHVLIAQNGQQAMEQLAEACLTPGLSCPVLVFLDLNMPVMNGIDFLEAYRPLPPALPMVVIILTTTLHPNDLARLQLLPHAELINKPLTEAHVAAILHEHFHR